MEKSSREVGCNTKTLQGSRRKGRIKACRLSSRFVLMLTSKQAFIPEPDGVDWLVPIAFKDGLWDLGGTGCLFLPGAMPQHYHGTLICCSPWLFPALTHFSRCCTRVWPDSCLSRKQSSAYCIGNKTNAQISDCSALNCHCSSHCCSVVMILRPATVHFHPLRWSQIVLAEHEPS